MKSKKRIAIVLAIVSLFSFSITAMANSLTRTINGHTFTATTSIASTSGFAGTLSSTNQIYATVNATYYYLNLETMKTGSYSNSSGAQFAASVSFQAPDDSRSAKVTANHSASSGGEYWSGSTSAIY